MKNVDKHTRAAKVFFLRMTIYKSDMVWYDAYGDDDEEDDDNDAFYHLSPNSIH